MADVTLDAPHPADCDGFGCSHTPLPVEEDHQGRTLYRAGCPCGFVVPLLLAGSAATAIDAAYEHPHPWGTVDVCGVCGET